MASEQVEQKALQYLSEGRVRVPVTEGTAVNVTTPRATYSVLLTDGLWACSCPSRSPDCAHVVALQKITVQQRREYVPSSPQNDAAVNVLLGLEESDIDRFLKS